MNPLFRGGYSNQHLVNHSPFDLAPYGIEATLYNFVSEPFTQPFVGRGLFVEVSVGELKIQPIDLIIVVSIAFLVVVGHYQFHTGVEHNGVFDFSPQRIEPLDVLVVRVANGIEITLYEILDEAGSTLGFFQLIEQFDERGEFPRLLAEDFLDVVFADDFGKASGCSH